MLLALETAVVDLLKSALPALFTGTGAATASFPLNTWAFDPLSADPVAGQPGPEDAVDELPFNPAAPGGPYTLTRPPYPGPKRVYLHSAAGELVALANTEVTWNPANPASFTFAPRPGRGRRSMVLTRCGNRDRVHRFAQFCRDRQYHREVSLFELYVEARAFPPGGQGRIRLVGQDRLRVHDAHPHGQLDPCLV